MLNDRTKWCVKLANDPEKWNKDVSSECPSVITKEYDRLKELLLDCDVYGAYYEIKDLFEVIIKLPTLITIAAINGKEREAYQDKLFTKKVSLGDWITSLSRSQNYWRERNEEEILKLIKVTRAYVDELRILEWRNNMAHGAQGYSEDEKYTIEITNFVEKIKKYFDEVINCYKPLTFIENSTEGVAISYNNKVCDLYPFIQKIDGNIYFYNSIAQDNEIFLYKMLCYSTGKYWECRLTQEEKERYINTVSNKMFPLDTEQKDKIIRSMIINEQNYEKPLHIFEEICISINSMKYGILMLIMERASGKTSLCSALDQYRSGNVLNYENTFTRCFYISDYPLMTKQEFFSEINFILNTNEITSIKYSNSDKYKISQKSVLTNFYKEIKGKTLKLLLIIDGLDEITEKNFGIVEGILDLDLADNIYIMATSRSEKEEIGKIGNSALTKISSMSTKVLNYYHDERNVALVSKYILRFSEGKEADKIIKYCGESFLNAQLIYKIKNKYKTIFNEELNTEKLLEKYLELLTKKEYGEDSAFNLIVLLQLFATSNEPLLFEEVKTFMYDTDNITLMKYMQDISILLNVDRCPGGNIYSFSNLIYNEIISNKIGKNEVYLKAKFEIIERIEELILNAENLLGYNVALSYYAQFYYSYIMNFLQHSNNNQIHKEYKVNVLEKIIELFSDNAEQSDSQNNDLENNYFNHNLYNHRRYEFKTILMQKRDIFENNEIQDYIKMKLIILNDLAKKTSNPKIVKTKFNQNYNSNDDFIFFYELEDDGDEYVTSEDGTPYDPEDYEDIIDTCDGGYIIGQNDETDQQYLEERARNVYNNDTIDEEIYYEHLEELNVFEQYWEHKLSKKCCADLWKYIKRSDISDLKILELIIKYGLFGAYKDLQYEIDYQQVFDFQDLESFFSKVENIVGKNNPLITDPYKYLMLDDEEDMDEYDDKDEIIV